MKIDFVAPWGETFKNAWVQKKNYADGGLALTLTAEDGEPLSTVSVNLSDYGLIPDLGCIFVADYSEHEGMFEAMVQAGVLTPTGRTVTFGKFRSKAHEGMVAQDLFS